MNDKGLVRTAGAQQMLVSTFINAQMEKKEQSS